MEKENKYKQQNNSFVFKPSDLRHVPLYKYEKDFTFIVNGKKYETSRIVADLLSPKISQFHFIDETMKEIEINTIKKGNFKNIIKTIENQKKSEKPDNTANVINATNANITENEENKESNEEKEFICEILKILGNETYLDLHQHFKEETIEMSNVFERIEEKIKFCENIDLNIIGDQEYKEYKENQENEIKKQNIQDIQGMKSNSRKLIESEIDFISSNFHKIEKEKIKRLKVEIIEDIIRNGKLKIEDEDSLLSFLIMIYEEDIKKSFLFEYVKYENVSEEMMKRFVEIFNIEDLNYGIWESMSTRIIKEETMKKKNEKLKEELKERYKNSKINSEKGKIKEFRGIIYHLTKEAGGNIHDKGIVDVTSSSVYSSDSIYQPKNIVDFNAYEFFYSINNQNEWICIDFKDRMIEASHYSVRSLWHCGQNNSHLKSWVIEGSKDKENWEIVDRRENNSELNGCGKVCTLEIEKKQEYRFIRLRQTGPTWGSNNYLNFNSIEFYGNILKK